MEVIGPAIELLIPAGQSSHPLMQHHMCQVFNINRKGLFTIVSSEDLNRDRKEGM